MAKLLAAVITLALIIVIPCFGESEKPLKRAVEQLAAELSAVKVEVHELRKDRIEAHYADILEKTNLQLSTWGTPHGFIVGALAILVGVLGIVAVAIVYFVGNDYKRKLGESLERHRIEGEAFLARAKETVDARTQAVNDFLTRIQKEWEEFEEMLPALKETAKKTGELSPEVFEYLAKVVPELEAMKIALMSRGASMNAIPFGSWTTYGAAGASSGMGGGGGSPFSATSGSAGVAGGFNAGVGGAASSFAPSPAPKGLLNTLDQLSKEKKDEK